MAAITKPTVYEISVKTRQEKNDYKKMSRPVISKEYMRECIAISNELRKKTDK